MRARHVIAIDDTANGVIAVQVASALATEHHRASPLRLGSHGSIDWINISVADLASGNFIIG